MASAQKEKSKKKILLDDDIFFSMVKNREETAKRGGWCKERCYEAYQRPDGRLY